jgi:hypothetical protein
MCDLQRQLYRSNRHEVGHVRVYQSDCFEFGANQWEPQNLKLAEIENLLLVAGANTTSARNARWKNTKRPRDVSSATPKRAAFLTRRENL